MSANKLKLASDLEDWRPRWRDREELRKIVIHAKAHEWIKDPPPYRCPQRVEHKRAKMGY